MQGRFFFFPPRIFLTGEGAGGLSDILIIGFMFLFGMEDKNITKVPISSHHTWGYFLFLCSTFTACSYHDFNSLINIFCTIFPLFIMNSEDMFSWRVAAPLMFAFLE